MRFPICFDQLRVTQLFATFRMTTRKPILNPAGRSGGRGLQIIVVSKFQTLSQICILVETVLRVWAPSNEALTAVGALVGLQ